MEDLFYFFELLKKVPNEVWAAIMASLITLGGVYFSNRHSRKQQKEALKYDESQRDKEREMSLRREVLLEAAGAISNGVNALGRMTNVDISSQDVYPDAAKNAAAIYKLYIVSTDPTVQAVSSYYSEFYGTFLELSLKRQPLLDRKKYINELEDFREVLVNDAHRFIELKEAYHLEGKTDERRWRFICEMYDFKMKQQAELAKKLDGLRVLQQKEGIIFCELLIKKLCAISSLIPPAIFSVRRDLKMPLDEEAFLKVQSESLSKFKEATEKSFSEMRQEVIL